MKNIFLLFSFLLIASLGFSQIKVEMDGDVQIGNTSASHVTIENGRLGIGTNSPAQPLHVQRASIARFLFESTGGSNAESVYTSGAASYAMSHQGLNQNRFNIGYQATVGGVLTPRITIKDNGYVGIGRYHASQKLDVAGNIAIYGSVVLTSDKNLKNNIKSFDTGLDKVLKLNPVSFKYNDVKSLGETITNDMTHVGLLAQDLLKIAPELVIETKTYEDENEGNYKKSLAINDTGIKYLLINAIQEQQEIINSLEEKITELSNKVAEISQSSVQDHVLEGSNGRQSILSQNVPNPFNGETTISYDLNNADKGKLIITNIQGQVLETINIDKGNKQVRLNTANMPAGTYIYSMEANGKIIDSKKMVIK